MQGRPFQIMLTADPSQDVSAVMHALEQLEFSVRVCHSLEDARERLAARRTHAVISTTGRTAPDPQAMITLLRENPATAHIPIYILGDMVAAPAATDFAVYADGVIPLSATSQAADALAARLASRLRDLYHPVTLLPSGGYVHDLLEETTREVPKLRYMLLARLMGLKAFNVFKGYESGNDMLAGVADMLCELIAQRGNNEEILCHINGPDFCIITSDRRVESLCRTILVKSQRHFRLYYTPYEIMQGYITLEDEHMAGNYYLAEVMIAGVEIPSQWDSPHQYLLDMLHELVLQVEKESWGFKIITL